MVAPGNGPWWRPLERSAEEVIGFAAPLSPAGAARIERFGTEVLRQRWIAGPGALHTGFGHTLGATERAQKG